MKRRAESETEKGDQMLRVFYQGGIFLMAEYC